MDGNKKNPFKAMALYSSILAQLTGSILIGIFGGRWLDGKWGTEPLFLIIGLLLGMATGIYSMLRTVRQYNSGD
ncbi:MAG TPA: AtpZ/AtpI family protein [Chondromyces sp.]|nr:AtpZ/AtpI family protein [Chondromyces sp.]